MKKYLFTFISCLIILLYIPFNTFASEYDGSISDIPNITQAQIDKIQNLYNYSFTNDNLLIYYSGSNLFWTYDIIEYNSSDGTIKVQNSFFMRNTGEIVNDSGIYTLAIDSSRLFIFIKYNNDIIFKNNNLNSTVSNNYLLLSTSYENIVRSQSIGAAASNRKRYFSYIDYDIRYTIKGYNFDVYYLVDNTYKLIQRNLNTFTIYNHESKSKFKDSSIENDYPDFPTIPSNSKDTYKNSFKLFNFYFVINDEIDLNTIIVKAPDTDNLITDGNSNSQSATTNNNQSNQLLDNTVNQMESLENGFKNDLNSNLDNINVNNFNISGITQLSNAANFVRVQFDNLTKNNPFGTILGFSLFLGISLLIIGKRL